jgi:hypothetical protein
MQPGGELQNPYWGSEMLTCGEVVGDMGVKSEEVGVTSEETRMRSEVVLKPDPDGVIRLSTK